MFQVKIFWEGGWEPIGLPYATRAEAEWTCGLWRQCWTCMGDCFCVEEVGLTVYKEETLEVCEEGLEIFEEGGDSGKGQ